MLGRLVKLTDRSGRLHITRPVEMASSGVVLARQWKALCAGGRSSACSFVNSYTCKWSSMSRSAVFLRSVSEVRTAAAARPKQKQRKKSTTAVNTPDDVAPDVDIDEEEAR